MTTLKLTKADKNDFPTPDGVYMNIMLALAPILNIDFDKMIDGCCTKENKKLILGYTPEENGLSEKWHKDGDFVWLAVPYTGTAISPFKEHKNMEISIQTLFVCKAVKEATKGVITIALIQTKTRNDYFGNLITFNEKCHEIHMKGSFPGMGSIGNTVVIFGIKKGSIPNEIHDQIAKIPEKYKKKKNGKKDLFALEYFQKIEKAEIKTTKKKVRSRGIGVKAKTKITNFCKEWSKTGFNKKTRNAAYMAVYDTTKNSSAGTSAARLLRIDHTQKELKRLGMSISKLKKLPDATTAEKIFGNAYTTNNEHRKMAPKNGKLSPSMKQFCEELIMNEKERIEAYMISFPKCNTEKSAITGSYKLLKFNPSVIKEIKRLKELKEKKVKKISILPEKGNGEDKNPTFDFTDLEETPFFG